MGAIITRESELGAAAIQTRTGIADKAMEFIPGDKLSQTILAIHGLTAASILDEHRGRKIYVPGQITDGRVKERMKICFDLYATLRDPKQLDMGHKKALDHLPMVLRCELDGVSWEAMISARGTWNEDALIAFASKNAS